MRRDNTIRPKQKMRSRRFLVAGLLTILIASPGLAQDDRVDDARCYLAANLFMKAGTDREKRIAQQVAPYYLGRLSGTPAEVKSRLAKQIKTLNSQNNGPVMSACAKAAALRSSQILTVTEELAREQPGVAPGAK